MDDIGGLLGSVAHGVMQGIGGPFGGISQGILAHERSQTPMEGMSPMAQLLMGQPGNLAMGQAQQRTDIARDKLNDPMQQNMLLAPKDFGTMLKNAEGVAQPLDQFIMGINAIDEILAETGGTSLTGETAGRLASQMDMVGTAMARYNNPFAVEIGEGARASALAAIGGPDALTGLSENFTPGQATKVREGLKKFKLAMRRGAAQRGRDLQRYLGIDPRLNQYIGDRTARLANMGVDLSGPVLDNNVSTLAERKWKERTQ